jgi:hypothetical protein
MKIDRQMITRVDELPRVAQTLINITFGDLRFSSHHALSFFRKPGIGVLPLFCIDHKIKFRQAFVLQKLFLVEHGSLTEGDYAANISPRNLHGTREG